MCEFTTHVPMHHCLKRTAILVALAGSLAAQNLLFVENDGKPCLVVDAHGISPCIEVNGKVVGVPGERFGLRKVEEYLPYLISVRDLNVRSTYMNVNGGAQINNELEFNATFETGYPLEHVFVLLDMDVTEAGKVLFLHEVGHLGPQAPKTLNLRVPLSSPLGSGHFQFHVFVGGAEAFHSEIPMDVREAALDRMVEKRTKKLPDGGPKPFLTPAPIYPQSLWDRKVGGQAVISLWIRSTGSVRDPVVKSATDPAFGEAALTAARLWRFLPRIKDGKPVETLVDLPFNFNPPGKAPVKS
ncbi:TonB family C-terminal domain-containing protein [Opitutus sp. GAS368]|nr:TonB family C-terminal domain-containing protein [Opitutus sp. GAS368]